jgi:Fur family ferric uptake transcriptional regulator
MTVAHHAQALPAPSLTAAVVALRARGMRVSSARRVLLEQLFAADAPLSAEALAGRLDLAGVYRNLDALEAAGLVRHVHAGHGPRMYALARRGGAGFAACENCGRHAALAPATLDAVRAAIGAATGFMTDFSHFPIVGLCPACAAGPGARPDHLDPTQEHHAHP